MVLSNTKKQIIDWLPPLLLVAKYLRVLTPRPVLRIFCIALVQDSAVARPVSPTDDQSPPSRKCWMERCLWHRFYHISANYRVYCRMVIGFPADDVNSLIFITELLGFRFNFLHYLADIQGNTWWRKYIRRFGDWAKGLRAKYETLPVNRLCDPMDCYFYHWRRE